MESGGVSLQPAEQVVKPLFFNTTGVKVAHLQAPWPLQSDVQHGYRVGPKSVLVLASSILLVWSHSAIINSVGECGLCNQVKLARKKDGTPQGPGAPSAVPSQWLVVFAICYKGKRREERQGQPVAAETGYSVDEQQWMQQA